MPSRAIGVQWLGARSVGAHARRSPSTRRSQDQVRHARSPCRSRSPASPPARRPASRVAAVDVGILNLTRYQAPAPETGFYAQRQLGPRDPRLLRPPDRRHARRARQAPLRRRRQRRHGPAGQPAGRGDGRASTPASSRSTPTARPRSTSSCPTSTAPCASWPSPGAKDKLGHAHERRHRARRRGADRLRPALPHARRRGAPRPRGAQRRRAGRRLQARRRRQHGRDEHARRARARPRRPASASSERVAIKPTDVGLHTYDVRVTGPDGIDVKRRLTFDVKPPAGDIKRTTVSQLAAKGGKLTLSNDLVRRPHRQPHARQPLRRPDRDARRAGAADRARPLSLWLRRADRLAARCRSSTPTRSPPQIGIAPDKELKERVQKAIERVFEMQDGSGAFGVWGPGNGDLWLTGYVTDFLTRAKESGYHVRQPASSTRLSTGCRTSSPTREDFEKGGEDRAYALYVLARNGRAPVGELRYYADTRLDRFSTPLAKAQLGAALAMMGDKERAETAFKAALADFDEPEPTAPTATATTTARACATARPSSRSPPRPGIAKAEAPRLVNVIAKAYLARNYTSTQEQAWMLLAAQRARRSGQGQRSSSSTARRCRARSCARSRPRSSRSGADRRQRRRGAGRCGRDRDRRRADAGAAPSPRASPSSAATTRSTASRSTSKSATGGAAQRQAERAPGRRAQARERRGRRPRAARRPAARRPRDREPAARRQRRRQGARLAQDDGAAGAHRVPRRPLRRRFQLLGGNVEQAAPERRGQRRPRARPQPAKARPRRRPSPTSSAP